ncbi:MAG: esterase-like activity of phytase family protein [Tateyamaria sp.]|uniref:esterase-like activity of phytase family protein n=1 Tax=Tateyamaria sp. TaxID=1929288 RepID=UPI00327B7E04
MRWRLSLALILAPCLAHADPLTFQRATPLRSDLLGFGGLSAIEMQGPDNAIVLSDRGQAFTLTFDPDKRQPKISPTAQPRPHRDSEGLAYAGGTLFFSYEGPGEIVTRSGTTLPNHPDFVGFHNNGSLEALAGAPDGTLYTLPERSGNPTHPFPIYRFRNDAWDIIGHLPRQDAFLPAGADIGPDGMLYILERAFGPLGFRSRIVRLDLNTAPLRAETLLTTPPGRHDNLEGLTIWQSQSGATCLTMVSDDNFLPVQRSELVEYALTETLAQDASCD